MTRTTPLALTLCCWGLLAPSPLARAQQVTVEQLVATAIERSPELQAARTEVGVVAAQAVQAALRPNPTFAATQEQGAGWMMATSVGLEWPLDLFRRPARVAVARSAADVTSLAIRDRERLLAATVREQAGRLLAAQRTLDVITESLTAARRMRDLLDRRVTEGGTPKLDANLAAVEAMRLEAEAALASGDVAAAAVELRATVGLAPDAPLAIADSLEGLAGAPAAPRLTPTAALESRPDLREAIARITVAERRAEQARQEARTDVMVAAGYTRSTIEFGQLGFDARGTPVPIRDTFHAVTVGARVSLPWRNRNEGTLAAIEAERKGAEALFAARQRAARADIDAALAREKDVRRAVELYATTVRSLARQNVDVMLEAYDLGRFPLTDVLAEQRRYLDVEAGYTAVLMRAYDARTAVARAFGEVP
jgi:cobalt-zinc-cadmium efflux system outer membrane protein